jgi:hypothetical protein
VIPLIGAWLLGLVFIGGGFTEAGRPFLGFAFAAPGAVGLGLLFAFIRTHVLPEGRSFDTREGLTVQQLRQFINNEHFPPSDDTKIYVGDQGLNMAGAMFDCILDGHRVIVIERQAEPDTPASTPDLF